MNEPGWSPADWQDIVIGAGFVLYLLYLYIGG